MAMPTRRQHSWHSFEVITSLCLSPFLGSFGMTQPFPTPQPAKPKDMPSPSSIPLQARQKRYGSGDNPGWSVRPGPAALNRQTPSRYAAHHYLAAGEDPSRDAGVGSMRKVQRGPVKDRDANARGRRRSWRRKKAGLRETWARVGRGAGGCSA
ncbi:hypothetical protein M407DRAFT_4194 [Tulasnella calospora MUT 4182]|uniref:Uncharacterized protein n=1 Tax=Tulasnella calospora MUT 4182 TaxID=1051891 RepID=A0A0C3QUA4_9AGAM|nr:hypothetical protein M407DRAFT_4194 [Tulasnella calospora MUT 4182]